MSERRVSWEALDLTCQDLETESLIPVSFEAALCKPGNAKGEQRNKAVALVKAPFQNRLNLNKNQVQGLVSHLTGLQE